MKSYGNPWKGCKEALKEIADPFRLASMLSEPERSRLTSHALRYFEPLRIINETLESYNPNPDLDKIVDRVRRTDMRSRSFSIEAGFRVTMDSFKDSEFNGLLKSALDQASALRYETGLFTDSQDIASDLDAIRDNLKKQGKTLRLPSRFAEVAEEKVKKGREDYKDFLVKHKWIGKNPKSHRLMEDAASVLNTLSEKEDLKVIKKSIFKYIDGTKNTEFDMDDLENGIHPLRRHIRWIAIIFQALNMFVLYDENGPNPSIPNGTYIPTPQTNLPKVVLVPEAQKYAKIVNRGVLAHPIVLDKNVYDYLNLKIAELGECKTVGQRIERFAEIYLESGEAKGKKDAYEKAEKLASLHPQYFDFKARAKRIYSEIQASGIFDELSLEVLIGIDSRLGEINGIRR